MTHGWRRWFLISPVRLSYSHYMESEEFGSIVAVAQRLIDQGDPEGVLRGRFPIPPFFNAAS